MGNLKAVIETNVVFAGLANPTDAALKILHSFFRRQFDWINSQQKLDEYQGALSLSQKVSPASDRIFLHLLRKRSLIIHITDSPKVCQNPDDDKFLETAVAGSADFLVTKNLKHFPRNSYQGVRIVNVATFLKALEKSFSTQASSRPPIWRSRRIG